MVRFLIIGDLHGNVPKILFKNIEAIIAPGDFCSDKPRKYMFAALRERIKNPGSDLEWIDLVGEKRSERMLQKSLFDGRKILERLNAVGVPVFVLPGNWDWTGGKEKSIKTNYWKKTLIKGLKNVKDCHKQVRSFKGITLVGHGITSGPEYPVKETMKNLTKKQIREKKKDYKKLYLEMNNQMVQAKKKKQPVLLLTHNVPYNTAIDKIDYPDSPMNGKHMGSYLARELIEKHSPLVGIGGHMHEHYGKTNVGKTMCINAGFGGEVNTLLEIVGGKITRLEFYYRGKKQQKMINVLTKR